MIRVGQIRVWKPTIQTGEEAGKIFMVAIHQGDFIVHEPGTKLSKLSEQFQPHWALMGSDGMTQGWSSAFLERHSELLEDV